MHLAGSQSSALRDKFRKEIRQRHLQQIFATKRKLYQQEPQHHASTRQDPLALLSSLKAGLDTSQTLTCLGNLLYTDRCLQELSSTHGPHKLQEFCLQLAHTVFNSSLPGLLGQGEETEHNRRKCLGVLVNLIADKMAPLSALIPVISEGLGSNYPNLDQTSSEEVVEIGWLLQNILCQQLDMSLEADLEKPLEQLLTITQEMLLLQNLEIMDMLYRSVTSFFQHVDTCFLACMQPRGQVEHFKVHRLILLSYSISYNLDIQVGTCLLSVLPFLEANLSYVFTSSEKLGEEICRKCCRILGCGGSERIMAGCFRLLGQLVSERDLVVQIVKDYFQVLSNCLMYQGIRLKIEAINLLMSLCVDEEITIFMAQVKQLESIVGEQMKNVKDTDTLVKLVQLSKTMAEKSNYKVGKQAIEVMREHLAHRPGDVGVLAEAVVQQHEHRMS